MRLAVAFVATTILIASCTGDAAAPTVPTSPATTTTSAAQDSAPCLAGDIPFTGEDTIAFFGEADGDAAVIGGVCVGRLAWT